MTAPVRLTHGIHGSLHNADALAPEATTSQMPIQKTDQEILLVCRQVCEIIVANRFAVGEIADLRQRLGEGERHTRHEVTLLRDRINRLHINKSGIEKEINRQKNNFFPYLEKKHIEMLKFKESLNEYSLGLQQKEQALSVLEVQRADKATSMVAASSLYYGVSGEQTGLRDKKNLLSSKISLVEGALVTAQRFKAACERLDDDNRDLIKNVTDQAGLPRNYLQSKILSDDLMKGFNQKTERLIRKMIRLKSPSNDILRALETDLKTAFEQSLVKSGSGLARNMRALMMPSLFVVLGMCMTYVSGRLRSISSIQKKYHDEFSPQYDRHIDDLLKEIHDDSRDAIFKHISTSMIHISSNLSRSIDLPIAVAIDHLNNAQALLDDLEPEKWLGLSEQITPVR